MVCDDGIPKTHLYPLYEAGSAGFCVVRSPFEQTLCVRGAALNAEISGPFIGAAVADASPFAQRVRNREKLREMPLAAFATDDDSPRGVEIRFSRRRFFELNAYNSSMRKHMNAYITYRYITSAY